MRAGERSARAPAGARELDIKIAYGASAPAAARRALEAEGLPPELLLDVQLLASELVTNSVRHGASHPGQWIGLRARRRRSGLRLEVCDPGPGFPAPPPVPQSVHPHGGRGLAIVERLTDRWGARRTADGRWEVWAEIDRPAIARPRG